MDSLEKGITSICIVSADHYFTRPIRGLDPCYSEYRGSEVKQVPVIRVFGADQSGTKTCLHIHGVFPYIYIPYDGADLISAERFSYQVASSLDHAINISLGQASSGTQHVYKITPVKAFPFYGYHPREHQYLKIYFYNPALIKRAADLFQNGAILSKMYQPHESHLPYVLQFLIDYNLYGMSYLHVPTEVIRFRRKDSEIVPPEVEHIYLDQYVKRISTSSNEVDIIASFILNRLKIQTGADVEHSNPGISSIWSEERLRRASMPQDMPPVEVPPSQDRPDVQPTESHEFYKRGLQRKLDDIQYSEQTLNETDLGVGQSRKFNLSNILSNAVYPAECSQKFQQTLNASFVQDHMARPLSVDRTHQFDESLNESIVNEELVLSLSQNHATSFKDETLNPEEYDLLDVMRQLEEGENNNIDNDSILAPLSQQIQSSQTSQSCPNKTIVLDTTSEVGKLLNESIVDNEIDSDDDLLNEFSMILDCPDSMKLDQLDGGTDDTPKKKSPKRVTRQYLRTTTISTATPKRGKCPLDITIEKSPSSSQKIVQKKKISNERIYISSSSDDDVPPLKMFKKTAQPKLHLTPSQLNSREQNNVTDMSITKFGTSDSKKIEKKLKIEKIASPAAVNFKRKLSFTQKKEVDAEKSFITCRYTRQRTQTAKEQSAGANIPLQVISDSEEDISKNLQDSERLDEKLYGSICFVKMKKVDIEQELKKYNQTKPIDAVEEKLAEECMTKKKDSLKSRETDVKSGDVFYTSDCSQSSTKCEDDFNVRTSFMAKTPLSSLCTGNDAASRFDREKNFFPQPGPSHLNYYETEPVPSDYYTPIRSKSKHTKPSTSTETKDTPFNDRVKSLRNFAKVSSPAVSIMSDDSFDSKVVSFYDRSLILNSPPLDSSDSSSSETQNENSSQAQNTENNCKSFNNFQKILVTPAILPPTYDDVKKELERYNIPEVLNVAPFYGDSKDKHDRKEVGHLSLLIGGNKIADLPEYESLVHELVGLNQQRRKAFQNIVSVRDARNVKPGTIRQFFASEKTVFITPHKTPPTHFDAKIWLKAKQVLSNPTGKKNKNLDEDSPVNIRREKIKLIVAGHESDGDGNDDDDDLSIVSDVSFNLSPATPDSNRGSQSSASFTPASRFGSTSSYQNTLNLSQQRRRACVSLTSRLNAIKRNNVRKSIDVFEKKLEENSQPGDYLSAEAAESNESTFKLSQNSNTSKHSTESVSSDMIKKMLERSSFVQDFQLGGKRSNLSSLLNATCGFKMNLENFQDIKCSQEFNYLTVMSLEVFVQTRGQLKPDPDYDRIIALFYRISNNVPPDGDIPQEFAGIVVGADDDLPAYVNKNVNISKVTDEKEMLLHLVGVLLKWDPDILAGYEIEMASWGYVVQRGFILNLNLPPLFSRIPSQKTKGFSVNYEDPNQDEMPSEFKLPGRILLDVWRLMRSEIALTSYTFENVMYHILHRRFPLHSHSHLTKMWNKKFNRWIVLDYFLERNKGLFELLDQLDLIGRTSELAKLFGIQFFEVLSRGSQFRVESMMLRMAKPNNLVPVSPSIKQRAHMRAPEYLALILEPQSRFYVDPVIVLDFQSLYPSVIIGYNYCFSTCLGRVEHLGQSDPFEFGASQLRVSPTMLKSLLAKDLVTISPCGVVFLKSSVREGILPRMLREILDARLMVKQSMKLHKKNVLLQRVLHSRQLGLKLIANVTYGYTAANFSGRMPCVEVGDSVVSKGRETLERAIKLVETNKEWNVKVVYGDTDSLFVLVPGRTREEAFRIGTEIVDKITEDNPHPVKLKLEKVYQPCILQTKKRYVGYMYETPDQKDPVYEAKGIETVRRDGCPIVPKMLEKTLRILFSTKDVSIAKRFICRQFTNLLSGSANIQDLIFAKEFRGINGYKPGACVPALELTRKWKLTDPRSEPRRGERVPYIVVNGPPGVPLIRLVRSPHDVLSDTGLKVNAIYYITKVIIPPINRCLLLIGADANQWFADLPRKTQIMLTLSAANCIAQPTANKKSTISQYFSTTNCIAECGMQTKSGLCGDCLKNPHRSAVVLSSKVSNLDRKVALVSKICQSCCRRPGNTECISLDCPVLFLLNKSKREHIQVDYFRGILSENIF